MAGRGECPPPAANDLERSQGLNLGSRPESFRELTAPFGWERACEEAYGNSLAAVRTRGRVTRRLVDARQRAAAAQQRETVILDARSRLDDGSVADRDVMAAVAHALANPVFSLESCGAVVITWVQRS